MVNYPAIFVSNGTAILLLLVIIFSSKRSLCNGLLHEKIFSWMLLLNFLQCIIETVTFLTDGKIEYRSLSLFLNAVLFSNSTILAYFTAVYVDYKLFSDVKRTRRILSFLAIPAVLTIIGCLINILTPVFYEIDQYNIYHRTDLNIIPYVVNYSYIAYAVILIYLNREKALKLFFLPISLFVIPVLLGSLLQLLFYGYSLMWLGVAIGLMALYVNIQNEACYIDTLSGLFNRQYLNNLLLMHDEKKDTTVMPAGIMLDIDNFKSINNIYGHLVGDDAILTAGKILHKAMGGKGVICRYGGDEFIILMNVKSQEEIIDRINTINKQAALFNELGNKPYKINFSIGYGTYDIKHDSIDDFLRKIDASMYEEKKRKIREKIIIDRRCAKYGEVPVPFPVPYGEVKNFSVPNYYTKSRVYFYL